jgi:hypothetical protein
MSAPGLTQYFTATTLDGFIADADNSLAWLFTRKREVDGFLDYDEFIAGVGAMAMGSTTYEWIVDHDLAGKDPSEWRWPYASRARSSRTGRCRSFPKLRSRSPVRTSRRCTRRWSRRRPEHLDRRRR